MTDPKPNQKGQSMKDHPLPGEEEQPRDLIGWDDEAQSELFGETQKGSADSPATSPDEPAKP